MAIFEFVPGVVPEGVSPHLAGELGLALGNLHRLTPSYAGSILRIDRIGILRRAATRKYGLRHEREWHSYVKRYLDEEADWLNATLPRLPTAAIHHDLHIANVIMRDGRLAAVLDFDEVNCAPLVVDVVSTLYSFARLTAGRPVSQHLASELFQSYESVRPMSRLEKGAVGRLFDFKNIYEAAAFLEYGAPELTSVRECRSYQTYLANRKTNFESLFTKSEAANHRIPIKRAGETA